MSNVQLTNSLYSHLPHFTLLALHASNGFLLVVLYTKLSSQALAFRCVAARLLVIDVEMKAFFIQMLHHHKESFHAGYLKGCSVHGY